MPDRERRRWADTATGLGLTGQTAAAGTTVTELAAGWGTGQSAVRRRRRRRRQRRRRPGPAGSTAARPRLDGPSSPLPGQPCPQLLDLGAVLRLGGRLLDPLVSSRLFELRANSASFWGSDGTTSPFGTWPGCPVTVSSLTYLSLIHISEPTRRTPISYAVFCLKK